MTKILIAAGLGGTLPTLCRLAATCSAGNNPPSGIGTYIAIGLFFIIGMAVAFGFGESDLKKAFALGIAGPAIVTSTFSAVSQPKTGNLLAAPPAAAAEHMRALQESVSFIFGIHDANAASSPPIRLAQAEPVPTTKPPRLSVTSNLAHVGAGYSVPPLEIRFFSEGGTLLTLTAVDPRLTSVVPVPSGARSIEATIDGKVTTTKLPATTFESARLNINIDVSSTSAFLWALGSNRRTRIEGVSTSLDNVTQLRQSIAPPTSVPAVSASSDSLKAGAEVYSQYGARLGVVESVRPASAGIPAQIVLRAGETQPQ
jgi:hypothetical protein